MDNSETLNKNLLNAPTKSIGISLKKNFYKKRIGTWEQIDVRFIWKIERKISFFNHLPNTLLNL